jgi:hypothetical protein
MITRRGIEWLSQAADDPALCRTTWLDDPRWPYLLGVGRLFDVLTTDQRMGMETFDQLRLHEMPVGAVMVDRAAGRMGFFLPPGSQGQFARALERETESPAQYRYLGKGSYVVAPGPLALTGDRFEWLKPPSRPQHASPLQTVSLAVMFSAASYLIDRADHYGQATADVR